MAVNSIPNQSEVIKSVGEKFQRMADGFKP
jgi:hypothetical protein